MGDHLKDEYLHIIQSSYISL